MIKIQLYFLFVMLLSQATCWWEIGHMAVSQVAEKRLKEMNQTVALDKINDLIKAFANLSDGRSNTFVEASVWADDIKENKATYFDTYHFTDVVFDPTFMFASMTQPQRDVNSINVASSCISVLKTNKDAVTFERAFMARYLLHLVGDIHQPLHSVNMYNSSNKKGDNGGNFIQITTLENKTMNSHAYMDSMALEQAADYRIERPLTEKGKTYINDLADSIMKEYPVSYFGDELINNLSSHTWTIESYNHAVADVYSFLLHNKIVTKEWHAQMFKLCRERVALAGYRLASVIISIYK